MGREKAFSLGAVTEFAYGQRVAESLFDSNPRNAGWVSRSAVSRLRILYYIIVYYIIL